MRGARPPSPSSSLSEVSRGSEKVAKCERGDMFVSEVFDKTNDYDNIKMKLSSPSPKYRVTIKERYKVFLHCEPNLRFKKLVKTTGG